MTRRLRAYLPFARGYWQSMLSYDWNFWIYVVGSFIRVFAAFFLWQAIFQSSTTPTLGGFTFLEMAVYVFMTEFTLVLVFNEADWIVSEEVKSGSIAMNLIRPISYHLRVTFLTLGQFAFYLLLVVVPIWTVASTLGWFTLGIAPVPLANIGLYLLSTFIAFLMVLFFNLSFGFMAFFLTNIWGLNGVKHTMFAFLSGAVIPLTFFPDWAQGVLAWLPFTSMASTPILLYLGKIPPESILFTLATQLFWLGIFFSLSMLIYRGAMSRLTIHGG